MKPAQVKWIAALMGAFFGWMLCWTRFVEYDVIHGALRFKDWYLWKMFVSGVTTAFVGLHLLKRSKLKTLAGRQPIRWDRDRITRAHILGGAIFGVGWAVTGTCPGPAIAQLGILHYSAIFTLMGIMLGIQLEDRRSG